MAMSGLANVFAASCSGQRFVMLQLKVSISPEFSLVDVLIIVPVSFFDSVKFSDLLILFCVAIVIVGSNKYINFYNTKRSTLLYIYTRQCSVYFIQVKVHPIKLLMGIQQNL
jgi:hypothetical protein